MESYVMFCMNKTSEWLTEKPNKAEIISKAITEAPKLQKQYQARRNEIRVKRVENQKKKREEEAKRQARQMHEREVIFKDILYYGLYQTKRELEDRLAMIKGVGEKADALKAQLRFREQILKQNADAKLFRFSEKVDEKRRNLSWSELRDNCTLLIEEACKLPQSANDASKASFLIGKRIIHKLVEKSDEQDEEEEGILKEYTAEVISTVPGFPSWFNIKYETDDDIYVEKLQEEMWKGNVLLQA